MDDFLIRACKQETRSKLSSAGSGMKSGAKMRSDILLSQPMVKEPVVTWWTVHTAMTIMTIPMRPAVSHLVESPSLTGPGVMLTAEIRKVDGVVSRTMAAVPKESLVEASLTATACPVTSACAIARPLSGMEMWAMAQRMSSGRLASSSETSVKVGIGGGGGGALGQKLMRVTCSSRGEIRASARTRSSGSGLGSG